MMSFKHLQQLDINKFFKLSNKQIVALLLIILFGYFLRLGMIDMVDETVPLRNDAMEYYSYATNLKESGVYSSKAPNSLSGNDAELVSDVTRPPGYPLFLLPFVESPPTIGMINTIRFAQVLISTFTLLLSFVLFRILFNVPVALFSTFLVAISPHLISMNIYILTEPIFTFFLLLFILLLTKAISSKRILSFVLSGACLGTLMLIKPSISLFIFLFAAVYLLKNRDGKSIKCLTAFFLAYFLLQTPWLIFNHSINVEEIRKSKSLVSLQNGSYPGLMYNDIPESKGAPHRVDPNYGDILTYSDFLDDLIVKVTQKPKKYIKWYFYEKFLMMYSWDMVAGAGDIYVYPVGYSPYFDRQPFKITHQVMKLLHTPIMLLSFLCMIYIFIKLAKRTTVNEKDICVFLLSIISIYYVALHILVTPLPRYMIPLRPVSLGLAMYLVIRITDFGHNIFLLTKERK